MVNKVVITFCNHCPLNWALSGSTSTALQHLRTIHSDKITEAEESQLNSGSEPTPRDAKTPKRQFKSYADMCKKVDHCSHRGRKINRNLFLAILSSSLPRNILDNVNFAMFVECITDNRY